MKTKYEYWKSPKDNMAVLTNRLATLALSNDNNLILDNSLILVKYLFNYNKNNKWK